MVGRKFPAVEQRLFDGKERLAPGGHPARREGHVVVEEHPGVDQDQVVAAADARGVARRPADIMGSWSSEFRGGPVRRGRRWR